MNMRMKKLIAITLAIYFTFFSITAIVVVTGWLVENHPFMGRCIAVAAVAIATPILVYLVVDL